MKIEVNTWQRQMLSMLCGGMRGDVATIRKASRLLDILELTKEEKRAINLRATPKGLTWDDVDKVYALDIEEEEGIELLRELYSSFDQWPAAQRQLVLDLGSTLGVTE